MLKILMADCKNYLETSLTVVGEIGGNDYKHALLGGKSFQSTLALVPKVVKAISSTINVWLIMSNQCNLTIEKSLHK